MPSAEPFFFFQESFFFFQGRVALRESFFFLKGLRARLLGLCKGFRAALGSFKGFRADLKGFRAALGSPTASLLRASVHVFHVSLNRP